MPMQCFKNFNIYCFILSLYVVILNHSLLLTREVSKRKAIQTVKARPIDPFVLKSFKLVSHDSLITVLEITVGHWLFFDQFQHLANQNPFWLANFTVHIYFWGMAINNLQNVISSKNGRPISDPYFYHCNHWDNASPHNCCVVRHCPNDYSGRNMNTHNVMYVYNLLGVRIIWQCVFAVNRNVILFHGGHLQYEHCPAVWILSPPTRPVCYSSYR